MYVIRLVDNSTLLIFSLGGLDAMERSPHFPLHYYF